MRIAKWLKKNTHSLLGKTVAISGATGGLGTQLCLHLASLGASLILLDRNMEKSHALAQKLRAQYEGCSVSHIQVDMEHIDTVKAAAASLRSMPLDYLILNAGAYSIPRHKTDLGYDNVFQINFIAPYYLARTLLPHLRARGGKVIAVGSIAHNYSKTDPTDVDFSTRAKASLVYGNAKRHLTYALYDLMESENEIAITHPGITFTNITSHYPKLIFAVIKYPMKVIFMSPRRASLSVLSGLFWRCGKCEWIGPRHFRIWGIPRCKKLTTADKEERTHICSVAEQIYQQIL